MFALKISFTSILVFTIIVHMKRTYKEVLVRVLAALAAVGAWFGIDVLTAVDQAGQEAQQIVGTGEAIDQTINVIKEAIEASSGAIDF